MIGLPESMPYDSVKVIDQTSYTEQVITTVAEPRAFIPFISPRGVGKDGQLVNLNAGNVGKYGKPNLSKWGLSLYLVNQYIKGGGSVLGMRLAADDAALANIVVLAKHKVETDQPLTNDLNQPLYKTATGQITTDAKTTDGVDNTPIIRDVLLVKLQTTSLTGSKATSKNDIHTEMDKLRSITPDTDGFLTDPLFAVFSVTKGEFANNYRVRVTFDTSMEPDIETNRFYKITASEGGNTLGSPMTFTFDEEYIDNGISMSPEEVLDTYSENIGIVMSSTFDLFKAEVAAHGMDVANGEVDPDQIDILFGLTKQSTNHFNYVLDPESVSLSAADGLALKGGSDGNFAPIIAERITNMNKAFVNAFTGKVTDLIYDEIRYPYMHVFDPSDDADVKNAIDDLVSKRLTTFAPISIPVTATYTEAQSLRSSSIKQGQFKEAVYCESAIVVDEYTGKKLRMPAAYFNAYAYAKHSINNGFANPFAGNQFRWEGFVAGTMLPQSTSADVLKMNHLLRMNQMIEDGNGFAYPYQQISAQAQMSKLSEINNAHILLKMIRISLGVAARNRWSFISTDDVTYYKNDVQTAISEQLGGTYKSVDITVAQESANGAGKNRIRAKLSVLFKDMLKGVSYEFYIV